MELEEGNRGRKLRASESGNGSNGHRSRRIAVKIGSAALPPCTLLFQKVIIIKGKMGGSCMGRGVYKAAGVG